MYGENGIYSSSLAEERDIRIDFYTPFFIVTAVGMSDLLTHLPKPWVIEAKVRICFFDFNPLPWPHRYKLTA